MMSTDRLRAGRAVLLALASFCCAGSAGATDAPFAAGIGAGIDHTKRPGIEAAQGQVSVAVALDLLNRTATQTPLTRQPAHALAPSPIGGLRGLVAQGGLDASFSGPPLTPASAAWTPARRTSQASPYVRIREYERVLGISFKIQPPPQPPESASPGL